MKITKNYLEIFNNILFVLFLTTTIYVAHYVFLGDSEVGQTQLSPSTQKNSVSNTQVTKTPLPSVNADAQVKKTAPKQVNNNVKCTISPECGGGYKEMTQAACSATVCCEVGGNWSLKSSNDECVKAREALLVDCRIDGQTYRTTPEMCAKYAPTVNGYAPNYPVYDMGGSYTAPSNTVTNNAPPTDWSALYEQCKGEARQYVSQEKSICGNSARAMGTGGSACLDSKFDEMLRRMLGDCTSKYSR